MKKKKQPSKKKKKRGEKKSKKAVYVVCFGSLPLLPLCVSSPLLLDNKKKAEETNKQK